MSFNFNDDTPIYLQIAEMIKNQIISGIYKAGDKIPPIRELSTVLKANPNTVQKALIVLEDENLIVTQRTNGKFVTDNEKVILTLKKSTVNKAVDGFFSSMRELGLTDSEIMDVIVSYKEQK